MKIYGIGKYQPCPGLRFEGDEAVCQLVLDLISSSLSAEKADKIRQLMGIGTGCCIKARAFKDGKEYDFASLSKEMKVKVVKGTRRI
jgi:hypothetical protein